MVQSASRLRALHAGRGHAGYFRAHGDAAPLRSSRTAARPVHHGALRTGSQGLDGDRGPPRGRTHAALAARTTFLSSPGTWLGTGALRLAAALVGARCARGA